MAGQMWFGTRDYMRWVKCPKVNMPSTKAGWSTQTSYLSGGAYSRRSTAAHKAYTLSWDMISRDDARPITDFADRVYGTGAIYWSDPFTMAYNVLPQWWATPSQGLDDGIPLSGAARGESVDTPGNLLGYPVKSIRYTVAAATTKPKLWIPIPPGYTAWVGVHGSAGTGGTVVATPTTGATTYGTPVTLTPLSVTDSTRVNQSFPSGVNTGIELSLGGVGTIVLSGLMVQILPTGTTPPTGDFISGQGNSGCQFTDQPNYIPYSAGIDKVGVVANLVETEGWA